MGGLGDVDIRELGLRDALSKALVESLAWRGYEKHPKSKNSYRSAYFCHQVGLHLHGVFKSRFPGQSLERRQIEFSDTDEKRPGEWLLDIVWCEETCADPASKSKFPSKIYGALECESSTNGKEFFTDFAKLVHVRSSIKLYLAGVNHKREGKMTEYIYMRVEQAARFLGNTGVSCETEEWYLAFWPSPMGNVSRSLWDELDKYPHLNAIHAFALDVNRRIRRGIFRSVRELTQAIYDFLKHYNDNPRPFVWTKSADQILNKLAPLYANRG